MGVKLPKFKVETLLLLVFFGSVVLFVMKKCQSDRAKYVKKDSTASVNYDDDRPEKKDSVLTIPQTYTAPAITKPIETKPVEEPITSVPKLVKPVLEGIETDEAIAPVSTATPTIVKPALKQTKVPALDKTPAVNTAPSKTIVQEKSILYITIPSLRLRSEPGLKSKTIERLKLHEKVYFLGDRTDFKTEINLGMKMANEPWLKVETKKGNVGWVYGAGVDIMRRLEKESSRDAQSFI